MKSRTTFTSKPLSISTVTSTSTVQAQTQSVTSEVTERVGLSFNTIYATVALPNISKIIAEVLLTRKE